MNKRALLYVAAVGFALIFTGGAAVGQSSDVQPRPRATPSIAAPQQVTAGDPDTGVLKLVDQSVAVGPNGVWFASVNLPELEPGHSIVVNVHDRTRDRSAFQDTLSAGELGVALSSTGEVPLEELAQDSNGAFTFRVDLNDGSLPAEPGQLRLQREGVYPILIELRDEDGSVVDRLITHLIRLPDAETSGTLFPLRVALGFDLSVPPAHQPDGTFRLSDASRTKLSTYLDVLDQNPNVPVTVKVAPETLEALAVSENPVDAHLLNLIQQRSSSDVQIVGPYVDLSEVSLTRQGFAVERDLLRERADVVTDQLLPELNEQYTWITSEPVPAEEVAQRWADGQRRIVVSPSALTEQFPPPNITPRLPFNLTSNDSSFRGFVLDNKLQSYYQPDAFDDPILAAYHVLADLSTIFFDLPGRPGGSVIIPAADWEPNPLFLSTLMNGLARSQLLAPVTIDGIFQLPTDQTALQVPVKRDLIGNVELAELADRELYDLTELRLRSFASMVQDTAGVELANSLIEQLPVTLGSGFTQQQRTDYWNALRTTVDAEIELIQAPPSTSFTLTAREDSVPLRFLNQSNYPMQVVVRLSADKLEFPDGNEIRLTLQPNSVMDHNVAVRVLSAGAFPMNVEVYSANNEMPLVASQITIRSSVLSGAGVALTAIALTVLALWWGRHILKTYRAKRSAGAATAPAQP